MNKSIAFAVLSAAGLVSTAMAQYTFEYRIIADGDLGAPTGLGTQYPISGTATQIGFWIQARVSQTTGQNWGIGRCTAPQSPNCDFLTVSDIASTTLNRGTVNSANTNFGRGTGYRTGTGQNTAATNSAGNAAFPSTTGNLNGSFDQGGQRIYGWDAYVGGTRTGVADENGDLTINPWAVNGGSAPAAGGAPGSGNTPVANGVFSPWANLYRFIVLVPDHSSNRTVTLNSSAQLNGTVQAAETSAGSGSFAMQLSAASQASATYTFAVTPTPGAAALFGLGALAAGRRRR